MPTALGPKDFKKIAIVGSAPTSTLLAPWNDPEWAIWCCSPAIYPVAKRSDVWFELHRFLPYPPGKPNEPGTRPYFSAEFAEFLNRHPLVFMSEKHPAVKNSEPYPYKEMLAKHGPYHFNSTISWIIALALECKPEAIGLFGIDMAANEEYAYQRPGCQHFLGLARSLGIEVVLPPESDLMRPPTLYGISEHSHRHIKLRARLEELQARRSSLDATFKNVQNELNFVNGAIDNMNYMMMHWIDDDHEFDPRLATSMAGSFINGVQPVSTDTPAIGQIGNDENVAAPKKTRKPRAVKSNGDGRHVGDQAQA